ncbi:putative signal transduction protein containing sensor and EAL domain [Vibrio nigripulchritudo SOn1]|uniref:cyclic-guanylate-specific phosphodiesterase n=1 Tax=Vibrio nigripulchritudo SOn1 TaxID=1238450 RepID=A0AAV2VTD3_9VIBR|nr:EAL domain-containing protein [Vibrio nigripulchritudo]CCO47693.1 putative signal transduction protein containing sensor and EAL domain [Vibrio nigripulchritudo SOn1]
MKTNTGNPLLYLKAFILSFVIAMLSYFSIQGAVGYYLWKEQNKDAIRVLETVSNVHKEVVEVLTTLNHLQLRTCSDEHNLMMRKLLFTSDYIKDIGYLEDNTLFCTTGKGKLSPPFVGGATPHLVTEEGFKFWRHVKLIILDNTYDSLVIRKGNYNIVLDEKSLNELIDDSFLWELVYLKKSDVIHFGGHEGIFSLPEPTLWNFLDGEGNNLVKQCDIRRAFCLGMKLNPNKLDSDTAVLRVFTIATSLLIGLFAYMFSVRWLKYLFSDRYRIRKAINSNSFHCVYQPIVDLRTQKTIGVEMLTRYSDRRGSIEPNEFIPIIVQTGQTWQFTQNMMKKAISELHRIDNLPAEFKLNVNIFSSDINKKSILELVNEEGTYDFRGVLVLEVTESEELEDSSALHKLRVLRDKGMQIAIDDFGTGYSNLHQLRKMNAHSLKIDRSFIQEMEDASIRSSLIEHIVAIAKQENLLLVAEGIENSIQHRILREMGVEYGQGWAFSKELSLVEFEEFWCQEMERQSKLIDV